MSSLKRDVKKTARREARFLSRDPPHCRFMSRNKFAWLSILSFCADGDAAVRFERAASAMVQNQSESNGAVAGSSETGCSATDSSNAWAGSAVLQTRMPLDTTSGHQSGPRWPAAGDDACRWGILDRGRYSRKSSGRTIFQFSEVRRNFSNIGFFVLYCALAISMSPVWVLMTAAPH